MIDKLKRTEDWRPGGHVRWLCSRRDCQRAAGAQEGLACSKQNWLRKMEPVLFLYPGIFMFVNREHACYFIGVFTHGESHTEQSWLPKRKKIFFCGFSGRKSRSKNPLAGEIID